MDINYDVPLLKGNNANIKAANKISIADLIKAGFSKCVGGYYFVKTVGNRISFNVIIKDNLKDVKIEILDNRFLQPYDYQEMLKRNPNFKPALKVHNLVQKEMKKLINKNIITGYNAGDYI